MSKTGTPPLNPRKEIKVGTAVFGLVMLLASISALMAGDLNPPGPPTSGTMKTLGEVEPRIPISQADIPKTISESGSYYLTEDVNSAGTAITVTVNDVTIDLMGYTIKGPDSGANYGIYMSGRSNVEVRNGTVRDFGSHGIYEGSDISGIGHRVIDVRSISNGQYGINLRGNSHLIKDCTAAENGICGIYARLGCMVTGNTAHANGITGILVYQGSTVTDNTASMNTVNGIQVTEECNVVDNNCFWNGYFPGDGAGIRVAGTYNRIEHNNVTHNDRGIEVNDGSNLVVRNSAANNPTEYDIVAGNKVGTISTDPTTAGPWDNFDF